ncbi:MAG: peptidoglycan DD-metalloendopeptidase family protein [Phototrophicaceae bacterium]|jgi:murein DD-endopeptidase MepM/ murein hydrolase activator NlpD
MRERSAGLIVLLVIFLSIAGLGFVLWNNGERSPQLIVIVPTQLPPTDDANAWQNLLREGFGSNSTPLPTVAIPTRPFTPPTLPVNLDEEQPIQLAPAAVGERPTELFSVGVTPTNPPTTPTPLGEGGTSPQLTPAFTQQALALPTQVWQPPPLVPPLSLDPLGRDHYWFSRPVDSNATNFGLFYYPYGSDGPTSDDPWRVHHGIDMPNPIGETVRAAGAGQIIWAADSLRVEDTSIFQNSPSYGNVVVIEHDFGYRGQKLYTLYAHLSAVLVEQGQLINGGDVIGLVGQTGRVSGPHVHFEVRLGENIYGATYNPVLWMVSYVGHGVIAGNLQNERGEWLQDREITLRRWSTGVIEDTTTSYVLLDSPSDVNPDPLWQENFTFGDVPVGRYEVISLIDGRRISKIVDVAEGTTSFVELKPENAATPQGVELGEQATQLPTSRPNTTTVTPPEDNSDAGE